MTSGGFVTAALLATRQWHLFVSIGIGLLIGLERERRKGKGPTREAAGLRTFALVSLVGCLAAETGGALVLAVLGGAIAVAAVVAYATRRNEDPGLTTQVALMTTFLLGALAWSNPALASALAVVVTVLLAARTPLHRFVRESLSERELHDGLIFASAALVILPLVPDRPLGPYGVVNPFVIWRLVVIVMAISAGGYIAMRLLGARLGLAIAGFAGGFVSSTIAVAALGARARETPRLLRTAVAGAMLASLASTIELAVVIGATHPATLTEVGGSLALAGLACAVWAAIFSVRAMQDDPPAPIERGRAFDLRIAVLFAVTVTAVLLIAAILRAKLGTPGLAVGVGVAGLVDVQAGAISVAGLVAVGKLPVGDAAIPILAALTANGATKAALALVTGRWGYAQRVWPGLALAVACAWAGVLLAGTG
jgi:uncharacterized membrane protein (DUF4010 family)